MGTRIYPFLSGNFANLKLEKTFNEKIKLTRWLISFFIFVLTSWFECAKGTRIYPLPSGNFVNLKLEKTFNEKIKLTRWLISFFIFTFQNGDYYLINCSSFLATLSTKE
jgi:hypothetical protein